MNHLDDLKTRIKRIISEVKDIIKVLQKELNDPKKVVDFHQVKEIKASIERLKKRGVSVPEELIQLKLKLFSTYEVHEEFLSLYNNFLTSIHDLTSSESPQKTAKEVIESKSGRSPDVELRPSPAPSVTTPLPPSASRSHQEELIEVAEDCPADRAKEPPDTRVPKTVARIEYEVLKENPYRFTEKELHYEVHAVRRNRPDIKYKLFNIRRSSLLKIYGWGIHRNQEGELALIAMESDRYKELQNSIKRTKASKMSKT